MRPIFDIYFGIEFISSIIVPNSKTEGLPTSIHSQPKLSTREHITFYNYNPELRGRNTKIQWKLIASYKRTRRTGIS